MSDEGQREMEKMEATLRRVKEENKNLKEQLEKYRQHSTPPADTGVDIHRYIEDTKFKHYIKFTKDTMYMELHPTYLSEDDAAKGPKVIVLSFSKDIVRWVMKRISIHGPN